MKKIIIFTGSRADYGILKNLILDLKNKKKILTKIYAGAGASGERIRVVISVGRETDTILAIGDPPDSKLVAGAAMALKLARRDGKHKWG